MVPPLVLHPPSLFSLAFSSSSGTQWPYEAVVLVNAQARSNLLPSSSAALTLGFQNTGGGYGVRACLLPPGTSCIVNPPSLSMAPSVRCASDTLRPHKRVCKVPEVSKCRSWVSIADGGTTSDCKQGFKSIFKAAAFTRHGRSEVAVMELERPAEDCLQLQNIHSNGKKTTRGRMKSAEELHFEAVEDYCRKYEDEVDSHHVNDVVNGVTEPGALSHEAPQSPMHVYAAVVDSDAANTPVDESNYVNGAVPWHSDGKALQSQANGCKVVLGKTLMQNGLGKQTTVIDDVAEINVSQSLRNADEKSTKKKKSTQMKTIRSGPHKVSARRIAQASKVSPLQSSGAEISESKTVGLDLSQQEEPQSKDNDIKSEEESTKFEVTEDLSEQQKIRMELNKAAALARRNMRVCEDAVTQAQAQGLSFPKFESLLVEKSWAEVLRLEFPKLYMERLHQFVSQEAAGRIPIYPPPAKLFNAFNSCPFDEVKVVIIGQDPYHGPGQAMGLCFSVEKGIKLPSSLSNIFLEIESDVRCDFPSHGNLEKWAHQGVLLLNTVLTVRDHHANSHAKKGWELFTDAAIRALAQKRSGVVFLLWGNQAQEKLRLINKTSHHALKAFHPSGISAHKGFFKCRHFSKTNQILVDEGLLPIDWQL